MLAYWSLDYLNGNMQISTVQLGILEIQHPFAAH